MGKAIVSIIIIIGVSLGYYYFIKLPKEEKTEYEICYEKCATPVIGSSKEDCESFCRGDHELLPSKTPAK